MLGQKIAELLSVHPGDTVRLIMVKHSDSGVVIPKVSVYKVEGIVSSGYQELDALWFFIPLDEGFSVMAGTDAEFTVGLTTDSTFSPALKNIEFEVQKHILSKMNSKAISGAWVSTWMELNRSKFENFSSTKILLLLIMLLIVLVASVNISSALVMVVMERRKEIAILKSTGATASGITASFLMVGFCCGAGGVLLGLPFGLLVSININGIIRGMERIMNCAVKFWNILVNGSSAAGNVHLLDPGFYLQEIPVTIPVKELLLIVLGTLVLSIVVSALPAIKAGQEKPLDTLRKM